MRSLTVIRTEKQLNQIRELCEFQSQLEIANIQRQLLCKPLERVFPDASLETIHYELIRNGLFTPNEWRSLDRKVKELKANKVWEIVTSEYELLKNIWGGPEVSIYIYPLTKYRPTIDGMVPNKNGVAYNNALFLFVSTDLNATELKALFAHEYHHICRLHYLNLPLENLSLMDAVVFEGMAEHAVEQLYGESYLSPWTKRYTKKESIKHWEEHFVDALFIKGVNNFRSYLYGDEERGLPNWIGYCIGYHIVQSFQQNDVGVNSVDVLSLPTNRIVAYSDFPIKE